MSQLSNLFDALLDAGGSDLHISPNYPPMYRVHGDLVPIPNQSPLSASEIEKFLFEILDDHQREIFRADHDLDFVYAYGTKARFRGNYLGKTSGTGAVFRTIPTKILALEQLNLPNVIRTLSESRGGLILVTGPTGSGKSTTLAAMIDYINKTRAGHILTVEDPVEFVHTPQRCQITHKEVGRDVQSFADAIRSAGREDADVVLLGELRGYETMRLALQMAGSGVLVFATVHTNSAPSTIERFINAFPSDEQPSIRGMLADALTGIVAQQLLKKIDGKGRLAAQEILVGTKAVSALIREAKSMQLPSIMQGGRAEGMQTMDSVLEKYCRDGLIKATDALEKAADKEIFSRIPIIAEALKNAAPAAH